MIYRNRVNTAASVNTLPYAVAALPALVDSFSAGAATGLTPNTATTGNVVLGGTLAATNGGTGVVSPTAGSVLVGNGASAVSLVAPSTSGNVLTSNGTTWTSTAKPAMQRQIFTTAGASTFTVPAGVTQLKVTVIGGGGGGGLAGRTSGGGASVRWITGLVPGAVIATTVGAGGAAVNGSPYVGLAGGSSSFGAYCSATGGLGQGLGGLGSGGDLNSRGGIGSGEQYACATGDYAGVSGGTLFTGGTTNATVGVYGAGGSGAGAITGNVDGAPGVILVEWIA